MEEEEEENETDNGTYTINSNTRRHDVTQQARGQGQGQGARPKTSRGRRGFPQPIKTASESRQDLCFVDFDIWCFEVSAPVGKVTHRNF